ncbi:hypothetical protein EX30DRAFT_28939 [Ascodesmis nigricans]|uniref:Ribonuclease H2 subunit B n=1 Tax=Ascodesmis nigricans TaxID=341454 RepID=A0A4S2N8G4_9PEZI|nr:hypothetical protein EX30DRAFT_28939 [Ascodesmis nigricans]
MAPKICLLPADTSDSSTTTDLITFITLPHPRCSAPTRYLLHPTLGLHEFTLIPSRKSAPRSWLLAPTSPSTSSTSTTWLSSGHVLSDSSLYISTRLDPLFLLLPALLPEKSSASIAGRNLAHWTALLAPGSVARRHAEQRIRAVCDSVDVGGGQAYRVSEKKVMDVLMKKCQVMVEGGLPKSLEEEFVIKPLVKPLTAAPAPAAPLPTPTADGEGERILEVREDRKSSAGETLALPTPPETQQSTPLESTTTSTDTAADNNDTHLHQLLRLRTASQFLSASYLPAHIESTFLAHFAAQHDFTVLDTHLAELKCQRAELAAVRSSDFSMKRGLADEEADDRAEKRRKKEEEERKKKKTVTQGVKQLSKVNTRGMAKMTSFFKKVEPKK